MEYILNQSISTPNQLSMGGTHKSVKTDLFPLNYNSDAFLESVLFSWIYKTTFSIHAFIRIMLLRIIFLLILFWYNWLIFEKLQHEKK